VPESSSPPAEASVALGTEAPRAAPSDGRPTPGSRPPEAREAPRRTPGGRASRETHPTDPPAGPSGLGSGRHRPNSARDVVVVGAGPAGAAAAYWLARAGYDVAIVEKAVFPRAKTCGDGLTPRAVRQLLDMGLAAQLGRAHPYDGLRATAQGQTLELRWPTHPGLPTTGLVLTRFDLDQLVAGQAVAAGATLFEGHVAEPLFEAGVVTGVVARPKTGGRPLRLAARYVVVADGSNSRVGRALGASRQRSWPLGMAIRSYWASPRSSEPWLESHFALSGEDGRPLPGYGWIFPLGDGRVNVGVGLLTTSGRARGVNTTRLLDTFVRSVADDWGLDPDRPLTPPTGGKLPMGLAVGPRVGPGYLLAGDAAGAINPYNGEGIAYGYETGRLAAWAIGRAFETDGDLSAYEERLRTLYGGYYRLGRGFVRVMSQPSLLSGALRIGLRSKVVMEPVVRLMANLLRPDDAGPAELVAAALGARGPAPR
jgi:geranylgeranyl reductase family protein